MHPNNLVKRRADYRGCDAANLPPPFQSAAIASSLDTLCPPPVSQIPPDPPNAFPPNKSPLTSHYQPPLNNVSHPVGALFWRKTSEMWGGGGDVGGCLRVQAQQPLECAFRRGGLVAAVSTATGVGEVNADKTVLSNFGRAAEVRRHTALRGEDMERAIIPLACEAALGRKALCGDVDGGLSFVHQRAVVTH